ncbi:MAG: TadE family type IV pilus minor pilin [Specibacter sp.]
MRRARPRRARPGRGARLAGTRGSVTAETAVVLPAITALLALLLLGVSAGMLQLRLEEGARSGARALARGDSAVLVLDLVSRVAGDNVSVSLDSSGGYATVTVQGKVDGVLAALVPWTQSARASARVETAAAMSWTQGAVGAAYPRWTGTGASTLSLWRWARASQCPFRTAVCEAVAVGRLDGRRGCG